MGQYRKSLVGWKDNNRVDISMIHGRGHMASYWNACEEEVLLQL